MRDKETNTYLYTLYRRHFIVSDPCIRHFTHFYMRMLRYAHMRLSSACNNDNEELC